LGWIHPKVTSVNLTLENNQRSAEGLLHLHNGFRCSVSKGLVPVDRSPGRLGRFDAGRDEESQVQAQVTVAELENGCNSFLVSLFCFHEKNQGSVRL
ncbi:hypothetical protein STEG23_005273, partial [Scotinomys teguina]